MLLRSFPILLLVLSAGSAVTAQTVVRGPYIQQTTETSAILRWRTSAPTDSRVVIGVSPGGNLLTITDPDTITDHEVLVSGLSTDTLYHYQVGTTTQILAGGGADHHFRTHPPIGSTDPVRIWAIGDLSLIHI